MQPLGDVRNAKMKRFVMGRGSSHVQNPPSHTRTLRPHTGHSKTMDPKLFHAPTVEARSRNLASVPLRSCEERR